MQTLCISQTPEADSDKEVLRISLDPRDGVLVYAFQETGSMLPKYQHCIRRCSPDEGLSRFERVVQLKKWYGLRAAFLMSAMAWLRHLSGAARFGFELVCLF